MQSTPYPVSVGSTLILSSRLPSGFIPSDLPINNPSPDLPRPSLPVVSLTTMRHVSSSCVHTCFITVYCTQSVWDLWLT